jgi:hypothetical protein
MEEGDDRSFELGTFTGVDRRRTKSLPDYILALVPV